jgi:hypothetical protein
MGDLCEAISVSLHRSNAQKVTENGDLSSPEI